MFVEKAWVIQMKSKQPQERAIRTRRALLKAAAECFDESGYYGAGTNKILARAGMTQGAMYFHFKSKEELAHAVMLEQAADLVLPPEPRGLQQLVNITLMLAVEMQHNVLLRAGVRLAVDPGGPARNDDSIYAWWAALFHKELVVAREAGELRPEVDEESFSLTLVGAYTGTQLMSEITTGRSDLTPRIMTLWRFLLPGIATPDMLAALDLNGEPVMSAG
ncbi:MULTISPECIES: ScbR family autoregulator-binding transcription factor [unclassified Streptomyces]|uniref:ScbR family autoregulator-binding transcription factor n=1 Tax=unclassified Streptomyces TaxID=2593676 RepID=UPI0022554379|nr:MULTISPECIES: ScbR family autoregulator-binding transcription factor [unclassified Streptomyces]MCX4963674.1 ScbR family autoregulator-binding transcription factor [Streptomyces sp. NBC_00654]MEE1737923.1 ScbR family autoregulator-binding transcription factor [Streptomyces sp. BE147]